MRKPLEAAGDSHAKDGHPLGAKDLKCFMQFISALRKCFKTIWNALAMLWQCFGNALEDLLAAYLAADWDAELIRSILAAAGEEEW